MEKKSRQVKRVRAHKSKWPGVYFYEVSSSSYNGKPDRCFCFTFKVGGKKIWKHVGRLSEGYGPEIAAEYRARTLVGLTEGTEILTPKEEREDSLSSDKTIKEIADSYFEIKTGSAKGIETDRNRYEKHILPQFGSKRVSEIKPFDVAQYTKKISASKKPGTVWNILEMLRRLVNYGFKMQMCPRLNFDLEMPRKDNEKVEYLTPAESKRFLKVIREWEDKDVGRMLQVAYFTGMRRGEIFKLEERDLDFELCMITLRDPKGGKSQSIGMSDTVKVIFLEQIYANHRRYPKAEVKFIFPGKGGTKRVDCSAVDRIRKAAELPENFRPFHGLRHNFGVMLANSGKFSINDISEALTHKNLDFTKKRYAQFLPGTLVKIGNDAAKILETHDDSPAAAVGES